MTDNESGYLGDLDSCPNCGNESPIFDRGLGEDLQPNDKWIVGCGKCGESFTDEYETKEEARKEWNNRYT